MIKIQLSNNNYNIRAFFEVKFYVLIHGCGHTWTMFHHFRSLFFQILKQNSKITENNGKIFFFSLFSVFISKSLFNDHFSMHFFRIFFYFEEQKCFFPNEKIFWRKNWKIPLQKTDRITQTQHFYGGVTNEAEKMTLIFKPMTSFWRFTKIK